jgi:tetratricopeptide (TPR) repeat protein
MALFGAPLAHEDHAVRACYAALRMQESVKRYAEGVRREHGITVRIRVGLNSGEVVVRAIGSDLHMDYTAVGQTTHLAARMEQLADPEAILLTADTLAAAEGFVRVHALGPMALKGLPAPVEVYELVGVSAVRSRLQAAATRGLSRFVGRDAEIEQLRRALEHARQGRGQVAAIVGEPGVGKSRLVFELTHSHRVDGWLVLEAGSVSYGKATSYLPVIDLLKAYFRVGDRDTYREIREKVTGKILTLDRGLEPALPALLSLLDVPVEDPQWAALDPPQRRQRTLESVKRLLLRETQAQPVLLVFEDLHWIDSETQALLDSLIESLPAVRMLLLVNYRPEYCHGWGQKTYYGQLRLDPLPPESTGELLEGLLGSDPSLQPLKSILVSNTEGNPLFLEESVRTLVDMNALVGERGAYRLARAVETVRVPATVQAILAARVDRLPPEEKRLLETAAVIGKDFPFALLQAIAEEPDQTLRARLDDLQAAEFVYETSLYPDLEYTFKHALTHDVAYGGMVQDRRRRLHADIAAAIERVYPDRLEEHVERVAHHSFLGERWDTAVAYLMRAGQKMLGRSAYRHAAATFEQALLALERLPESRERLSDELDVRLALRGSLHPLTEFTRLSTNLATAADLAERLGDQGRLAQVHSLRPALFWLTGQPDSAIDVTTRVLQSGGLDERRRIASIIGLAQYHHTKGNFREALQLLARVIEATSGPLKYDLLGLATLPSVQARAWTLMCWSELGEFKHTASLGDEALEIANSTKGLVSLGAAYWGQGQFYLAKGDLLAAIPPLEKGYELCRSAELPILFPLFTPTLGLAYLRVGRTAEALERLHAAVAQTVAAGFLLWQALRMANLGEALLATGDVQGAMRTGEAALDMARKTKERPSEAWALRLIAETSAQSDEAAKTVERFGSALALAGELRMRPLVAHCHLGLGTLYRRTGDRAKADEHLTTARAMYREMDMGFYLAQADRVSAGGDP